MPNPLPNMTFRDSRVWLAGLYLLHFAVHQLSFHAVFLDSDQLVIADQAAWMARGEFFEPFFFGQAYLFPFEAYLAVPVIWLGLSPVFAVKLVAGLAFYLPFVWISWVVGRKRPLAAWSVALLLFLLPMEFLLAAPLPRGFIVATALAWFGLHRLLRGEGDSAAATLAWGALVGFCLGSYMSAALMLPALALLERPRRMLLSGLGLGLGHVLLKAVALFYRFHPEYVVHRFPELRFSRDHFLAHLSHETIAAAVGSLLLLTLAASLAALATRGPGYGWRLLGSWRHGAVVVGVLAVIAVMLATNKIADFNIGTPFFSVYRMLLPLPLLALLVAAHASAPAAPAAPSSDGGRLAFGAQALALVGMLALLGWQAHWLVRERQALAWVPSSAPTVSYEKLERQCARLGEALSRSGEPFYRFRGRNDALAYGCHAEFGVPVMQRDYERRTWLEERLERAPR